jgi:hypothetical protein
VNPGRTPLAQRAEIGEEIRSARAAGTPWKMLEWRFGYRRIRLRMLLRAAESVYEDQAASQGEPNA